MGEKVTIVGYELFGCRKCHSRLQDNYCYNCRIKYMEFEWFCEYPEDIEIQNIEEVEKIYKARLRQLEWERSGLETWSMLHNMLHNMLKEIVVP